MWGRSRPRSGASRKRRTRAVFRPAASECHVGVISLHLLVQGRTSLCSSGAPVYRRLSMGSDCVFVCQHAAGSCSNFPSVLLHIALNDALTCRPLGAGLRNPSCSLSCKVISNTSLTACGMSPRRSHVSAHRSRAVAGSAQRRLRAVRIPLRRSQTQNAARKRALYSSCTMSHRSKARRLPPPSPCACT